MNSMNNFIPVEAREEDHMATWYIDISKLSLNELIIIKKELVGNKADSIRYIDAIIHQNIGCDIDKLKMSRRETSKESRGFKKQKTVIKHHRRKRR